MLWHAFRTLEDFWGPATGDRPGDSYFAHVAAAYLAAARQFDDTPTSQVYAIQRIRERHPREHYIGRTGLPSDHGFSR